jgi:hypothetical protein
VALFEVGLVAVGGQQLGVGRRGVVGDQREAAVGAGVVGERLRVDLPGQCEARLGQLAVAGAVGGAAAPLLAEALLGGLGDRAANPARGAGVGERGGRGLLDSDAGAQPALG